MHNKYNFMYILFAIQDFMAEYKNNEIFLLMHSSISHVYVMN